MIGESRAGGGVWRTGAGRLRLGWRLLLFLGIGTLVSVPLSLLLPGGLPLDRLGALAGFLVAGWILLAMEGRRPGALGFRLRPEAAGESAGGLALGTGTALLVVLLATLAGGLAWEGEGGGPGALVTTGMLALWSLAIPAAAEEVLFRGYPFQAVAEAWGPGAALGLTAALFGLIHAGNPAANPLGVVNVALAGVWLGVVFLRTGSLWWATGAHLGWNWALAFLADLEVSGLDLVDTPYLETVPTGAHWLAGGAFGPEASLPATVVLAAASLWIWRAGLPGPGEAAPEAEPPLESRNPQAGSGGLGAGSSDRPRDS